MFTVVQRTEDADPLEPKGDPKKGDARTITVKLPAGPRRHGIYGLQQVLTWETAAVKRIDQVSIGSQGGNDISLSQKGMVVALQPLKPKPKEEAPATDSKGGAGAGMPTGATAGAGGKLKGSGVGMGGMGGAADKDAGTVLANGLVAERYLTGEVTPQFRRLPVAVVLIVDQNHVNRVLTAFNNSRLRFLMTQVLVNHYTKSVKPDMPGETPTETAGGGATGPAFPNFPMGGPGPGMLRPSFGGGSGFRPGSKRPMGPSPMGPAMPMGGGSFPPGAGGMMGNGYGSPAVSASDDLEANMELVIYGIVTLYNRYPPQPAGAATGAAKAP